MNKNTPIDEDTAWEYIDDYTSVAAEQLSSNNNEGLSKGVVGMLTMGMDTVENTE